MPDGRQRAIPRVRQHRTRTVGEMERTTSPRTADARRLGGALEPVIAQVYFSPECHDEYASLGFDASPGQTRDGVALPDGVAYFTSRGASLGQVPGQVVAAAFGVFNPEIVVPSVERGWKVTDAATLGAARDRGALAQLERLLGPRPEGAALVEAALVRGAAAVRFEGRALTAGLLSLDDPDHPLGTIFRRGDVLREYRGDSHIAAWVAAGLTAIEIGLLTELYWGLSMRTYSRTRGWSSDQYDAATASLRKRGLITDDGFTDEGRALRERIEVETDEQMAPVLDAIGDDLDEVVTTLESWGRIVREGKGYPGSGPHDLAEAAGRG